MVKIKAAESTVSFRFRDSGLLADCTGRMSSAFGPGQNVANHRLPLGLLGKHLSLNGRELCMAGNFSDFSYNELDIRLNAAVEWLSSLGARIESTRIQRYRKSMDDLLRLYHANDYHEGDRRRPEFVNLLLEAHELLEIHKGLAGVAVPDALLPRIRMLSHGPDSYADENPSSGNFGRNAGFELLVASLIAQAGLPVKSAGTSDVSTDFGNRRLVIECKRPYTDSSAERNRDKALRQLKKKYSGIDGAHTRGIVALDMTRVLSPDFSLRRYGEMHELEEWIDGTIESLLARYIPHGFKPPHRKTIAMIIRFTAMAVPAMEGGRIVYCQQNAIKSFASSRQGDRDLAEAFVDTLQATRPD